MEWPPRLAPAHPAAAAKCLWALRASPAAPRAASSGRSSRLRRGGGGGGEARTPQGRARAGGSGAGSRDAAAAGPGARGCGGAGRRRTPEAGRCQGRRAGLVGTSRAVIGDAEFTFSHGPESLAGAPDAAPHNPRLPFPPSASYPSAPHPAGLAVRLAPGYGSRPEPSLAPARVSRRRRRAERLPLLFLRVLFPLSTAGAACCTAPRPAGAARPGRALALCLPLHSLLLAPGARTRARPVGPRPDPGRPHKMSARTPLPTVNERDTENVSN